MENERPTSSRRVKRLFRAPLLSIETDWRMSSV
nr:hypothetical protein [Carrot red leaf luteovirus associated RNA]